MLLEDREARVTRLVAELASIRRRGIEQIDMRSTKQQPVEVPELDQLADQHATAGRAEVGRRVSRLKHLFRSGLAVWQRADPHAAQLVRDVLFGESAGTVTTSAGDLLRAAMRKAGQDDERRFRAMCNAAFHDFAEFLISFVDDARADPGPDPAAADLPAPGGPPGSNPGDEDPAGTEVEHYQVTAGYIGNRERFVELLAAAANVTIVGVTNEHLAVRLEAALERKRAAARRPDAFWNSLRVVFLREDLLDHINDERPETPDRTEALRQRRFGGSHGRRSVNAFLHRAPVARWEVYESPFLPPMIGSLFELPGGSRIVHVVFRNPQRGPPDHLYLEFADTVQQYFTAVFDAVIHSSTLDTRVVLLGVPHGDGFRCSSVRFRYHVLRDGSGATGWLPVVLVITWRRRGGNAEPLLQLRLPTTEFTELYRLSHPVLLIHRHDLDGSAPGALGTMEQFNLHDACPARTARRRLRMDTGTDLPGQLHPVTIGRYLHADKEHLFYFVFSYEFPADFPPPRRAELHPVPLPELLAIRQNQTLRQAANLCQARLMPPRAWAAACEIAALNLALDGHAEQGRRLAEQSGGRGPGLRELAGELAGLEQRTRQENWTSSGEQVTLAGLSGLLYREFYTILLPAYAQVGVDGAAALQARLSGDPDLRAAISRLATLYQDEEVMSAIPVEL
jgi:hypothetical protein